jgi:DNA-binding NarL/FixJ family response regulator
VIRVFLTDDQELVCYGLQTILQTADDIEIVGMAHDGQEALDLLAEAAPDVVLMDLNMPVMNGIQATQAIQAHFPGIAVLVLTTYDDDEWLFDAIRSGAAGYLLKDSPREALIAAVRAAAAGETPVDPSIAGRLFTRVARDAGPANPQVLAEFSDREIEILRGIARGLSNQEIAADLHLSDGTVRNYVTTVFEKLDVSNRTRAAIQALQLGLVDLREL